MAEFHPSVWGDFFITHAFHNEETVSGWNLQIEAMKEEVKTMLSSADHKVALCQKLNLIDVIKRLGIGYHFELEIEDHLHEAFNLHPNLSYSNEEDHNLSTVALHFRLLRHHGYNVPSNTFNKFMEEDGEYFKTELRDDVEGMLSLYEAAHLRTHGEKILEKAIDFTTAELKSKMQDAAAGEDRSSPLLERVGRALNGPKGVAKQEQLLFISWYEREVGHNPTLLSLAKLSWNVLQHMYHQELRDLTIWDTSMKDLPEYMKVFFQALIDVIDEIGTITSMEGRPYCLDNGKQAEKKQMGAYLAEARWFAKAKVPSVEEYRHNGIYSSTYPLFMCAALCGMGEKAPKEVFDWLFQDPKILVSVSDLGRLMDDIVSHEFEQKRGHVASSVECYMNQYDVSREEAVGRLKKMVDDDWLDINEEALNLPGFVSKEVRSLFLSLGWVTQVMYQEIDSYTVSNTVTKDTITALLVAPLL